MSQHHAEFSVLYFSDRRQLAQFLGHLDACLTQDRGHRYSERSPELELWACTDTATADTLTPRGPCLYANDAVLRCVAAAGLAWTYAGRIARAALPENAWPVLGPSAYPPLPAEQPITDFAWARRDGGPPRAGESTAR